MAYGEIIARKLKKLGAVFSVGGYYHSADRPTVDKEYLIDLVQEAVYDGEACAKLMDMVDRPTGEWVKVIDEETQNVTKWHYECD